MTPPLPLPGELLGGYQLEAPLGRGGWSRVYTALQLRLNRRVALKVLAPEHAQDPLLLQRFEQEVHLLTTLQHPHIVAILDAGTTPHGLPWIALELLHGPTLQHLLKQHPHGLPPHLAARLAMHLLSALRAAHAQGVLHRDLKPSNVIVTHPDAPEPFAYLLDFGIAKILAGDPQDAPPPLDTLQMGGGIVGSPRYMPPEAFLQRPLTPASDLFALALVFAECLGGRPLLEGDTEVEVIHTLCAPQPLTLPPRLASSPFAPLLRRALHKDPAQRFPSADAMLDALKLALPADAPAEDLGPTVLLDGRAAAERAGLAPHRGGEAAAAEHLQTSLPGATRNLDPQARRRATLEAMARVPEPRLPTERLTLSSPPTPTPAPRPAPARHLPWLLLLLLGVLIALALAVAVVLVAVISFSSASWPPVGHN